MNGGKKDPAAGIHRLLAGSCAFFLLMSGLAFGFFLLGNYQSFTPRSQFLLLEIVKAGGFLSLVSGLLLAAERIAASLRKKGKKSAGLYLAAAAAAVGVSVLAAAHFIIALTRGFR